MIRWVYPVNHFGRTATKNVELGGQKIAKGDSLVVLFGSESRDENSMEGPQKFDVKHNNDRNMTFGFGAHSRLGRYFAKMEIAAFFQELLPRTKTVELDGESAYMAFSLVVGLKTLPIRFEFN
jgi:cytochrome P450